MRLIKIIYEGDKKLMRVIKKIIDEGDKKIIDEGDKKIIDEGDKKIIDEVDKVGEAIFSQALSLTLASKAQEA